MERVTTTFDEETIAAIRRVAGRRGVSRFVQVAARERLQRLRLIGVIDELDKKHGRPSAELVREIERDARRIFRK